MTSQEEKAVDCARKYAAGYLAGKNTHLLTDEECLEIIKQKDIVAKLHNEAIKHKEAVKLIIKSAINRNKVKRF